MSKDDEDVLACFDTRDWVDEGFDNICVVHVQIATEDTPKDTLKGGYTDSIDSSGHESRTDVRTRVNKIMECSLQVELTASTSRILVLAVIVLQQRRRRVIKRGPDISLLTLSLYNVVRIKLMPR